MKNLRILFSTSIQRRLSAYFLMFTIIPVIIIGIILYQVSMLFITDMSLNTSKQIVKKQGEELDSLFSDMVNIPKLISADALIQEIMRKKYTYQQDLVSDKFKGDARLASINSYRKDIYGIYVLLDNSIAMKSRYFEFRYNDFLNSDIYKYVKNREITTWFTPPIGSEIVITTGEKIVAAGTPLKNLVSDAFEGIIVIEVRQALIQKKISIDLGKNGYMYLFDPSTKNIIGRYDMDNNKMKKDDIGNFIGDENVFYSKSEIIIQKKMSSNGWILVGVIPKSEIWKDGVVIMWVFIAVVLLFVLIALFEAGRVTKREMAPVNQMNDLINLVKNGNLDIQMKVARNDEMGKLTENFNDMINRLRKLIDEVYLKQKKLRIAEFKALQAQINPHFLYNTLDSINWLSREGNNNKVIEMVMALTTFFKIGISRGQDIITIKEEVEHVSSYLKIQGIRYETKFTYIINFDSGLDKYYMPKFILQPIVENAIYHGIKMTEKKCVIIINIFDNGDDIIFEIIDDGIGMTQDKLSSLENAVRKNDDKEKKSYGLVNVNERIKIILGEQYGLSFYSEKDKGTVVTVKIPKILEADQIV